MARIRTIKPEFFTSEDIVSLSPLTRLLYIALWCEADKEGRLVWKPKTLKIRYFPADTCDIDQMCQELLSAKLAVLYGDGYAYIPAFKAHQHINPRESLSQLPDPDEISTRQPRVGTRQPRDSDAQGGREGKGKEGKTRDASTVHGFPPGFESFWFVYPRKDAKDDAVKAFAKLKPDQALLDRIIQAVSLKANSDDWTRQKGKFIPLPASYLNGRRWEDEGTSVQADNIFEGAL